MQGFTTLGLCRYYSPGSEPRYYIQSLGIPRTSEDRYSPPPSTTVNICLLYIVLVFTFPNYSVLPSLLHRIKPTHLRHISFHYPMSTSPLSWVFTYFFILFTSFRAHYLYYGSDYPISRPHAAVDGLQCCPSSYPAYLCGQATPLVSPLLQQCRRSAGSGKTLRGHPSPPDSSRTLMFAQVHPQCHGGIENQGVLKNRMAYFGPVFFL